MIGHIFSTWWQDYCEAKSCNRLKQELLRLLHGKSETAEQLINLEKIKHPGQSQSWYLDKVIYDIRRSLITNLY